MSATVETEALEVKSTDLSARLDALRIADVREVATALLTRMLEESVTIRNLADDFLREVDATVGPTVDAAFKAHRAAVAMRDGLKKPAEGVKRTAGEIGYACDRELKRRQAEAERVQREEQERLQREALEQAERERAAAQKAAEDARLAQAVDLASRGDHQAAEKLIDLPVVVETPRPAPAFVPPAPQIAPARVEGASFSIDWDFEITDETLVPREYLIPDETKIRRVVKAMKGKVSIPGIKVVEKPRTTRRA